MMEAYKFVIVVAIMSMIVSGSTLVNGQSFCHMSKAGLKSCLPSVSGENPVPPTPACCSAIANADLHCLCQYKDSTLLKSIYGVDPNLAMALPVKCNVVDPSFHC
ncbi:putative bifunctional inhibitor/plant lipid transfer protein/seed storage helical [Lupinus albus]|uniref:Putative bifunctional inhibitor/plant lipid transfer protein/seed storage helical n=1 Tax=Lupinus albus TaxID=3870 RepID=A0A6A4R2T4_LUPAL|nr:putative bifunctional inhibitor/plant lipid transfer protein/seed storage helical [Lupinus albus]